MSYTDKHQPQEHGKSLAQLIAEFREFDPGEELRDDYVILELLSTEAPPVEPYTMYFLGRECWHPDIEVFDETIRDCVTNITNELYRLGLVEEKRESIIDVIITEWIEWDSEVQTKGLGYILPLSVDGKTLMISDNDLYKKTEEIVISNSSPESLGLNNKLNWGAIHALLSHKLDDDGLYKQAKYSKFIRILENFPEDEAEITSEQMEAYKNLLMEGEGLLNNIMSFYVEGIKPYAQKSQEELKEQLMEELKRKDKGLKKIMDLGIVFPERTIDDVERGNREVYAKNRVCYQIYDAIRKEYKDKIINFLERGKTP